MTETREKGNLENRAYFDAFIKKFTVIHNQAMIERGYGPLYTREEMVRQVAYCWAKILMDM